MSDVRNVFDFSALSEIDEGMSNCDHTIDDGFEEKLKAGGVYGRHAGWNFNGLVAWDGSQFVEEVWTYRVMQEQITAPTLRELMDAVNERYGAE